jgi:hypothetical protein
MKSLLLIPALLVAAALVSGVQQVNGAAPATSGGKGGSAAPLVRKSATAGAAATAASAAEEQARAEEILAQLAETYRNLEGTTVRIGDTPKSEEAIAYYTSGEIVIDREHTVGVEKILAHEIWHVIDWRDNGRLDWGEDLPPANASDYRTR